MPVLAMSGYIMSGRCPKPKARFRNGWSMIPSWCWLGRNTPEISPDGISPDEFHLTDSGCGGSGADRKLGVALRAFVFFDNDMKVHAPFDAGSLARKVEKRLEAHTPT